MPARHVDQICARCNTLEAVLTVRNDPLCRDCFSKYINTKVVKRMEAFRTRHSTEGEERKLLLPISLGVSSVSLLHILDRHLQGQRERTGRTGFSLQVLFITLPDSDIPSQIAKFDLMKERFPQYVFGACPLCTIFLPETSLASVSISELNKAQSKLSELMVSIPSATSRTDIVNILKTRLIVKFARENNCEGILWGSSTTKLAETVLAETAKGRGFVLPWCVTDGLSPYGTPFFYPMRDVLKKELISLLGLEGDGKEGWKELVEQEPETKAPPSSKNTTIDILMKQYFESVEEHYPSIVSNVVRTTGKLQELKWDDAQRCRLCELPVDDAILGINGWGGDQELHQERTEREVGLCYGCARSLPVEATTLLP